MDAGCTKSRCTEYCSPRILPGLPVVLHEQLELKRREEAFRHRVGSNSGVHAVKCIRRQFSPSFASPLAADRCSEIVLTLVATRHSAGAGHAGASDVTQKSTGSGTNSCTSKHANEKAAKVGRRRAGVSARQAANCSSRQSNCQSLHHATRARELWPCRHECRAGQGAEYSPSEPVKTRTVVARVRRRRHPDGGAGEEADDRAARSKHHSHRDINRVRMLVTGDGRILQHIACRDRHLILQANAGRR